MNAFDRYPPKAEGPRRRLPSHRRQKPPEIREYERGRARGFLTLLVFLGVLSAAYAMIFIVGRSILHHRALLDPAAARVFDR